MGSDKGLLTFKNATWVQLAADKMLSLQLSVLISINAGQLESYSTIFSSHQLVIDDPLLLLKGPLCGILSTHIQFPNEDILVLACDMFMMETKMLKVLIDTQKDKPPADAFVFNNNGEPEPLCGLYTAKSLTYILGLYRTGQLPKHSMKYMLEHVNTAYLPLAEEQKKYFLNFNSQGELSGL